MSLSSALEAGVIVYFFALNAVYFLLALIAFWEVTQHHLRGAYGGHVQLMHSPLTPPISVLVPAYNEEVGIALTVNNLLHLDYLRHEVVVINDGSKDRTLDELKRAFDLRLVGPERRTGIETAAVRGVYASEIYHNLTVIDKENGGKADALNAGLNAARHEYFCSVDADAILESDALQRVVAPILESPRRVIGVGGLIRVANGCVVEKGRVVEVELGRSVLAVFQAVEYARSFLCARTGFSRLNGLLIVSGAFGVFERGLVMEIGGYRRGTVGEDMDLVSRLHRHMRERGERDYSILSVPDPVCWTEVPESLRVLARQRRRWQKGLMEVLSVSPRVFLNPRYGVIGLFSYPFLVVFEGWGVLLEVFGYFIFVLSWLRGSLQTDVAVAFIAVSFACGTALSLAGALLSELGARPYPRFRDVARLMIYAVLENLGYRQAVSVMRLLGLKDFLAGSGGWGAMERRGVGAG